MTDFGRRVGVGDMLKSVYDSDENGVIAVAQTEADMLKSLYDSDDDGKVDAVEEHASTHEAGRTDEIDATGLVGAGGAGILGDGTAGRVFRASSSYFGNGSNASTLKCLVNSLWNGDVIALVDNIAKGATTDGFTLSADGKTFTIENSGLSGNVLFALSCITSNACQTDLIFTLKASGNDIVVSVSNSTTGVLQDLTTLVDTGLIYFQFFYITDA